MKRETPKHTCSDAAGQSTGPADPADPSSDPARADGGAELISSELAVIAPAALGAALEAIAAPAFVVKMPCTVLHSNTRGRALLRAERERVLAALRSAAQPRVARFPVKGMVDHHVVVLPDVEGDVRARLAAVASRWGLTPRQSAVLALVAQGEPNRTAAAHLGCSEKTVELHVSALLAKTRCTNRAQLVACFWTDPC
jgi:DNA-binding NarL/FixJ family response regulator